jgi:hypothetical protein
MPERNHQFNGPRGIVSNGKEYAIDTHFAYSIEKFLGAFGPLSLVDLFCELISYTLDRIV